jgi:hypothetical protein
LALRHIMRRVSDTESRPLSDLFTQLPANALLEGAGALPAPFNHYPLASASRFA